MDEMENQVLPQEPVDKEEEATAEAVEMTAGEEQAAETAAPETPPAAEPAAPETSPAAEQAPRPVPPPKRRSPYENSPYVMPHHPRPQAAPLPAAAPEEPEKKRKKHPVLRTFGLLILVAAVAVGAAFVAADRIERSYALRIQSLEEQIDVLRDELEQKQHVDTSVSGTAVTSALTPGQVYAMNEQSVVLIETDVATGSGFILTADGYVVTNYHVVEDGSVIDVVLYDRTYHRATLVGYEANNDVALLKIEGSDFQPVTLGSSDALVVGDQVAAIGNPLGELASTLTVGYISAKDRIVATDGTQINMLQTDAAINPGNSGGPLFNMKGEVIGITSAKYSGTTTSGATIEGIGFAIPMDDVLGMLNDLREYGYITGGYLGISVSDVDEDAAELYGLPNGVLVREVTEGSCAEKAGIKVQDIIVNLGGYEVGNLNDLSRALNKFKAGETVTVTVYRSGSEKILSVTLDERPREQSDSAADTQPTTPTQPSVDGSIEDWFDFFIP